MSAPSDQYGSVFQQFYGPDVRIVPAGGITPDERRNFRVDAVRAATYLHGEYSEQSVEVFRDHELDRVLVDAERIYEWIIAPPADADAVADR